jgi:hypothetical protein
MTFAAVTQQGCSSLHSPPQIRHFFLEEGRATSSQVVYDDDLVIHRHQLAAASSGVTSFSSMAATCAVFSDSALR